MTGKIENQVRAILAAEPDNAFTTADLCYEVYGDSPTKANRVSMLRVMKRVAEKEPRYALMRSEGKGAAVILYDCTNAHAYGMARLKSDAINGYQYSNRHWQPPNRGLDRAHEAKFRQWLSGECRHADYQALIEDGGTWWKFARSTYLRRSGEGGEELARLEAESEAGFRASVAKLKAVMRAEPPPEDLARQACNLLMRYFERTGGTSVRFKDGNGQPYLFAEKLNCFQEDQCGDKETHQDCCPKPNVCERETETSPLETNHDRDPNPTRNRRTRRGP